MNLFLCLCVTGRRGVFTGASGLQIAYVSGREALQEPAPAHCFTPKDLSALVAPLTSSSKFRGVDILLTSQWPKGVWNYANNPVTDDPRCSEQWNFSVTCQTLWIAWKSWNKHLRLSFFCASVAGGEHKVLWKQLYCKPCRQTETTIPLCCTRGRSLWKTPLPVGCGGSG